MFAVVANRDWPALWVVGLMGAFLIVEVLRTDGQLWFDRSFVYIWLFLAVYILSTIVVIFSEPTMSWLGRDPVERAMTTLTRLIYVIFAYMIFVNFMAGASERSFNRLFGVQMSVGLLVALFGIVQYITTVFLGSSALVHIEPTNESYRLYSSYAGYGSQRFYRASAFFAEPSAFGFFLVPYLIKAVVARAQGHLLGGKGVHAMIIAAFVVAIIFNLSMTAIISTAILITVYGLYALRGSRHLWKFAALFVLVVAVVVVTPAGSVAIDRLDRVFGLRDVSTLDRLFRVFVGLKMFVENILIGVGPGGFAFQYPLFGKLAIGGLATPLNVWVTFLTDAGILGLIPFVMFLVNVFRRGGRVSAKHPLVKVYIWGVISLLVLLTTLDAWYWEILWFEIAVLVSLANSPFLKNEAETQRAVTG